MLSAFEMLRSNEIHVKRNGVKELARITMSPSLASNIAHSGVLAHICDLVASSSTEIDSNFYNLVCSLLFKAGSLPECQTHAAHALSTIVGRGDELQLNLSLRGRTASSSTPGRPRPHSAAVSPSRPFSAAKSTRSQGATGMSASGTSRISDVGVSGDKSNNARRENKVGRDVLFLGPIALPCQTVSAQEAVSMIETGSMMYVYPPENERFKVFEAYVQVLGDGSMFVGGVRQNVRIEGAVRGCSEHVKSRFDLTPAQRKGCMRLHARPMPGFTGVVLDNGLATMDLRLHSVSDTLIWIKGINAMTASCVGEEEGRGQQQQQQEQAQPRMPFDGVIPERHGPSSYDGERDRVSQPCLCAALERHTPRIIPTLKMLSCSSCCISH